MNVNNLKRLAKKYRLEMFEKFLKTKQGHPGSIFSMMEIAVVLYFEHFIRFDKKSSCFKDKFLISKGHATSILYPILRDFNVIASKEWENWGNSDSYLRIFGNTDIPGIDVTSGSLGHCVGTGAGMALHYKRNKIDKRVFVIISEGELYEGSTWEALLFAQHHNLSNLTIIIDINNLIILGTTDESLKLNPIEKKMKGLDIDTLSIDGHNFLELKNAFKKSVNSNNLTCVLAKTIKGKGSSIMENKNNWHYMNSMNDTEIALTKQELSK